MIIKERTEEYIKSSNKFIELIGNVELSNVCGFTPQNITGWKQRGIPRSWSLFLRNKYRKEWDLAFNQ